MFNKNMVSVIREQSLAMEKAGTVTPQVLDYIYELGLFKLFVPKELGGRMVPLPEALRIFEQASWIDGSFGWLVTIGSGGGYFASSISPEVSRRIFSDSRAVIAGSGFPSGVARPVAGGYEVSGQWKFCSGSTHATVFTANCVIEADKPSAAPEIRSFILLPEQVKIADDWRAFGLKATASHSISVEGAYVPAEMTFELAKQHTCFPDPLFRYPFMQFAETSFAAVSIGVCRHFLDEARRMVDLSREAWKASNPDRSRFVTDRLEQADTEFEQAVANFYRVIDDTWQKQIGCVQLSEADGQQISRKCKQTAKTALHCAQSLFPYLGINAIMEEAPVNRAWRDLQTVCQHTLLVSFRETGE